MLKEIFEKLDAEVEHANRQFDRDSLLKLAACEFKLLGQSALLEAKLNLHLNATSDVDAYTNAQSYVLEMLSKLLIKNGLRYDQLSSEIWMPEETIYVEFYLGKFVKVTRAEPVYIMISKALKAPSKNKTLLLEFIAQSPGPVFFELCSRYGVKLDEIVDGK